MMKELVIIIPVHNPGGKLRTTLLSIRNMTHGDIVIINDGGQEDVSSLRDELNIDFTLLVLNENVGITRALNHGLRYCLEKGYEFIARIDAGDVAVNNRFEKQVSYLREHTRCMMVGSQVEIRNIEGKFEFYFLNPEDPYLLKSFMHIRNVFFHSSVMFRKIVFDDVGLYNESFLVAQDYELFFRIAQKYEVGIVNEILVYDLYNPNGISYARRSEQLRSKLKIQFLYFDIRNIYSYAGIVKSLIIILMPDTFIWSIKKRLKNLVAKRYITKGGDT